MKNNIYKEGSKDKAIVKQIQKIVGAYPDGLWGPVTTECVKEWQKRHGLTPDGVAGPATLSKMGLSGALTIVSPKIPSHTIVHNGVVLKKSKRHIDYLVVHCTATPEGCPKTVEQIRSEHKRKGWSDIGYHYVITLDGKVHLGRDVDISGAHVSGHNPNSIGIAYVGGLENKPGVPYKLLKAKDTRTEAQKSALKSLLVNLRRRFKGTVTFHQTRTATERLTLQSSSKTARRFLRRRSTGCFEPNAVLISNDTKRKK